MPGLGSGLGLGLGSRSGLGPGQGLSPSEPLFLPSALPVFAFFGVSILVIVVELVAPAWG